jgi:hypothetical protein
MLGFGEHNLTKNSVHFEFPDLEFFRGIKTFFWASLISLGVAFSTVTNIGSKNSNNSGTNPASNPMGNLFGNSEKSAINKTSKGSSTNSSASQQEALRRHMQMSNARTPQIGGNNSPMGQTSQAARQQQDSIEWARKNRELVKSSNSGKASQS